MSHVRQESHLKRNVGFTALLGVAVGQVIGAGIMSLTGVGIEMTGTGVALAFILSSFITLFTVIPTVCMSSAVPATGGNYRYVSRLLGKKFGFVCLVTVILGNLTIALYALSFASYFVQIFLGINQYFVAIIILIVTYLVNIVGVKQAAIVNTLISAGLMIGIFLFIAFGLPRTDFVTVFTPSNMFPRGIGGFVQTLGLLSFATGGAVVVAEMGGEVKNPGKIIPMVIIVATIGVGAIYALMASVAAGVLPISQVAGQTLSHVAKEIMPTSGYLIFMVCSALGATASTLNATFTWISKPFLVACDDGLLPRKLGKVSKQGVPIYILTGFFILGLLPLIFKQDISFIAKLGTGSSIVTDILAICAFLQLEKKYKRNVDKAIIKIRGKAGLLLGLAALTVKLILSASLLMDLPFWTKIVWSSIMIITIIYANVGLKNVTIPNDLAVDYTTK